MSAAILHIRSERVAEDVCLKRHGSENRIKRGRQKTVTWANDEKICEVCHFLVDDAPSLLGAAVQELLNCKQRSLCAHYIRAYGDTQFEAKRAKFTSVIEPGQYLVDVPLGFGHSIANKQPQPEVTLEASMAITVPWCHPNKFNLDGSWLWAGGEESKEVALQQQREMSVFEAFYPRLASVPDSPAEPQERCKDIDSLVSQIPLIPLEEEEIDIKEVEHETMIIESSCTDMPLQGHGKIVGTLMPNDDILHSNAMAESEKYRQVLMSKADPNIAAVAAAACMAVKALGESDLVDETLLLEILKNPSLLKSLTQSDQVMKDKSQDQSGDTGRRVSREPVTSPYGKLPAEHGTSPVSVLANWGEGVNNGSSYGTSIACGSTNMWPCANLDPTCTKPPAATRLLLHDPNDTIYTRRNGMQGVEIAPIGHKKIPDLSKNIPFKPSNQKRSCLAHVYGPKEETRLIPSVSSQNGVTIDNRQSMLAIATPNPQFNRQSVETITTISPSCGVVPSSLSNSELSGRIPFPVDPPRRRLVQNADAKLLQSKKSALGVSAGRAKRFCMYFNSPRGCRNGGSCAFVHQSQDSEMDAMAL
eukprot:c24351_g1_i1 orf=200-1963(+)